MRASSVKRRIGVAGAGHGEHFAHHALMRVGALAHVDRGHVKAENAHRAQVFTPGALAKSAAGLAEKKQDRQLSIGGVAGVTYQGPGLGQLACIRAVRRRPQKRTC